MGMWSCVQQAQASRSLPAQNAAASSSPMSSSSATSFPKTALPGAQPFIPHLLQRDIAFHSAHALCREDCRDMTSFEARHLTFLVSAVPVRTDL